jgi:uncharacterized membrane protein YccF (DUF307 family)
VIWFVFAGVWMAIGYAFAALIMFILIITIPFGVAALRIGIFALWPFGKTVVRRADAGAGSAIGNVLWFLLAGWWLIIGHLVTGVLLCLTIIGIPLGLANLKLIPVTLRPFGRDIVSIEEAERQGLEQEVTMPRARPSLSSQEAAASGSSWPRSAGAFAQCGAPVRVTLMRTRDRGRRHRRQMSVHRHTRHGSSRHCTAARGIRLD